jgi:pyruvate/2-oxoglutarate dehydrogenase complex dihydrolipoamide acyltransferase (E2) component
MRKIIAKRLTESKTTIPHAYSTVSCDVTAVNKLRKQILAEEATKVSVNDFIIKAVGVCLRKHPQINVQWNPNTQSIQAGSTVDISIAVATPNGLITPIVKDANTLTVREIGSRVKELAGRAKEGKLQPHEFQGGNFSISNLGMFGIKEFSAVINPPQAAILAVGQGCPVVRDDSSVSTEMFLTLSYDARAIEEENAASFLESLSDLLSNPTLLEREGDGSGNRRLSSLVS